MQEKIIHPGLGIQAFRRDQPAVFQVIDPVIAAPEGVVDVLWLPAVLPLEKARVNLNQQVRVKLAGLDREESRPGREG